MSTCVNLSLKEFKDCCERLNVSAATLEPIVHEYINTVGGENSFPTDAYIERVIHGSEQPVLSKEQVTLWEKRYSQPAQFDDVLEAMSYITEAERFFPRESIGLKETLDGKVEVTVARPYVETELTKKGIIQKFRKSLFRGQGGTPKIDENGNLVIEATYDSLFRNYGKSFATSVAEAYYYGERSSRNPYIIELDLDYLDTIIPLDENARTDAVGVRAIGDEYGGDAREERLQFEGKILIPKGKYKISRKKGEFDNLSSAELLDNYINYFNIWNSADELAYGEGYSRLSNGIVSMSDIKDIYDELVNRLGKEEADNFIKFYGEFDELHFDEFEYSSSFNPNDFLDFDEATENEFITNSFYKRVKLAEEKQQIKQKAIADGTFMKAPNGKPTNLTEDQWLSVRTKEFKEWFGDWEKFTNISEELLEQISLVFERNSKLAKVGTIKEYATYLKEIFPNSKDKDIYWHGSNSDFSQGFDSAIKGMGSGSPHIDGEFYLAKQAWTVLQYVNGVNRSFGPDVNGFNHWNKLWWELKEIMSNGRRENDDWKNLIIGPDNVRQAIPNKKGVFNRDSGGENGKWLKERKADYGYQDKTDAEFFKDVFGIEYGKDTFNTWTQRNAEVFKSLEKTESGIYPAVINATNPIRESGKNTYYELERGLLTQAKTKGNDTILGSNTDNEFHSDVAVVFNAKNNVHFLGTTKDITLFKQWLEKNRSSKVVDENGEPLVVYHQSTASGFTEFDLDKSIKKEHRDLISFAYHFGTLQSAKEVNTHGYNGNLFSVFLNLRTPLKIEDEEQSKPIGILVGLNKRGLISREQLYNYREDLYKADTPKKQLLFIKNVLLSLGYDGYYYINAVEDAGSLSYAVFESNQIKSAEFNIGYSKEDNNIYHNKNLKDKYYKLLEYVKQHVGDRSFSLKDFNYRWGTNFGFNPRTKEITTRDERIHDVSIWNPNDTKVEAKKKIDRVQLLNYLSAKFGLKFKEVSNDEYTKKAGSLSNCCVIGDTVYIRKGDKDKLTNEQLIEEFLHPLVNAIYKSNKELTNKLLEEAKKLFSDLTKQIAVAYADQSKQVQDEELITQVLSKYLNKEISDKGANTRTIADYIKQFFENILDLLKDLFGDVRIEKDTRLKVSGKDIKTVFGFENLAQLINSKEVTFTDTLGATEWRNNRTPKEFTFNDGVTVRTSFTPNEQQVQALNEMSDFIDSDETHMTLSGYAGTGKTSLMEMLAEKMNKQHRGIIFSASTNKAAAVLKARVAKSGFSAYTLNKVFGISVEVDPNKEYDAKDLITVLKDSEIIYPGAVVVIDEASMINEHNYNVLNNVAEQYDIKIIYVGDEAQLSPVKESKKSKVFRDESGRLARLTKVERTDDNAILKEATALRNGESLSGESSFNERGEGVAYISEGNKTAIKEIVQRFVKGLTSNPNYFRILAYTNKAVAKYNLAVRNALGYKDGTPRVGEPMTGYSNWGYEWQTKTYRFINSEAYKVTRVGTPFTSTITVGNVTVSIERTPITLVDSFGKEDTFNYVDIRHNQSNLQAVTLLAKEKSRLWGLARKASIVAKKEYLQKINEIDSYLFVNDNITEGNRTIQAKVIDFGYAMTVHKSQGSTFTHVLVDDVDISKATNKAEDDGVYEIDLETDTVTTISEGSKDKVDIQQQLRYVAVSRATNTVSIVSDDVKTEDSPLNHISDDADFQLVEEVAPEKEPIRDSYDEIFTPKQPIQPVQEEVIAEEESSEIEETIEDDVEQQFEEKQKEIDKAVKEAEEFITANNSFSEQVENLINSTDVNQSEITELANEVSYYMSDLITQWQDNPKAFFENFPTKRKETEEESIKWFNSLSRKQIVESIGIGNFLTIVKDRLFNDLNYDNLSDEEIDSLDAKAMLFYENFDALLRFGMSAFRSIEDFNISYSEAGYKVEKVEDVDNTAEGYEFDNTDVEVVEDLGDKQEHWQIDSRTIDNFLSMSQIVKRELTRCYITEIDEDGNTINKVNSFGVNKRVDPKQATGKILRWVQGAITLEQMIDKLKERQETNPWLSQIINKLEDKSGKYTDLQGQFFSVFCKHFQEYYYILETKDRQGNRVMSTRSANLNPALRDIMSGIEVAFKLHKHPLFDVKGVIPNKFNNLIKAYNKLAELNKQPFETLNIEQICTGISYIAEILGYNVSPEDVVWGLSKETLDSMLTAVSSIIDNVRKEATNPNYDPFAFRGENSIGGYLRTFLTPITEHLEDIAISAFYDSGKMYQSYVIPSYLTKLMKKFKENTDEEFKTFLKEEYGDYEWFRDTSDKKMRASSWKNVWLRQLASMDSKKRKELFGHKVLLNYNGHNYMRNMTSPEYILATLTEFLSGSSTDKEGNTTAWYKIPMMSNKPSFEFIKFLRYKGVDYQDTLTTHLVDVFTQELERIQTVLMRNLSKSDPEYIKNFDENGKRFMFLEYLNPYLEHLNGELRSTELGKLINKKLKSELTEEENSRLNILLKEAIKTQMNAKADAIIEQYKSNGVFNLAKNIENIGKTDKDIENAIRNFVWNDTFASINILQLTITDTAYYANAEDVQKRLAQIHAPGMRGNVEATDYDGEPVSDGTFRTIFLKDFDGVKSNIIENLEIVFDRKIEQAPENEKEFWRNTKKAIISQFEDINVADAQAYNSPTSYRKKAFMFGKWSRKSEEIYQKLKKGEYNLSDLETAFQPLKPFVYSQVTKDSDVEGAPIKHMKVNMQFKNSEYLLIMADAILQGEKTGKPNILRAIYEVMEESAEKYPTQGIDTVQFESAVKAGLHARLDLNQCLEMDNGEQIAKALIEAAIYDEDSGYYNTTYVHEAPFEDYTIQQEVPAHFKDHEQAQGSQERMIIPSDLARIDANGDTVFYTFVDDGAIKSLTAEEFRAEYEKTIAENIQESIDRLYDELGLNIPDKRVRNVALSKILQKEILSSPRYGMDLYIACSVDKDGNFNIPLGDPIQSKRIEQLINSIIKNRVNKQKVAGGPVVQVTNYGTSTQLHIKFKDKQGNILPTLTEWLEANPDKTAEDFKQYLKDNQGGVAYYECYAPAYMQELLQDFMNEHGELDIEAVEATNPELLDMIGYRIPSEDLYSVAPLRIKGFLPKEAGEGIMLPYEITLITGSDFDKYHC